MFVKYSNISSAYSEILCSVALIQISEILEFSLIDCASGSNNNAKSSGDSGQP